MRIVILLIILCLTSILHGIEKDDMNRQIDIFYKNRLPSLQTLAEVLPVIVDQSDRYSIRLHEITNPSTKELICQYNLPDTHFPFAVVVNGHFSGVAEGRQFDFVHFPLFMEGIGRHEGNWSLEDLNLILENPDLLLERNIPPEPLGKEDEPCPED
jgi:hypothetical protein